MNNFIKQLWARKVVQFGIIYLGAAWVLLQVAIAIEGTLELPGWVDQVTLIALGLGFPVALILAWAQDSKADPVAEAAVPIVSSQGDKKGLARIAVLPFLNMSGEAEKEFFADGMTEDIITGIARNPHFSVTSRTSVFAYKGQAVDMREAGQALGVDYVLEGSVRPMGDRIRITAQLIEASSGDHLWAENYDEPTEHLFDVQDKVIASITQALGVQLVRAELTKSKQNSRDLTRWQFIHAHNVFLNVGAESTISQQSLDAPNKMAALLKKDPDFAPAHVSCAWYHASVVTNGWSKDVEADAIARDTYLTKAMSLAPNDPFVLMYTGGVEVYAKRYEKGRALLERALELDPNLVEAHLHLGLAYGLLSQLDLALNEFAKARAGGLMATHAAWLYWYEGLARLVNVDMDEFNKMAQQVMAKMPGMNLPRFLQSATGALASVTTPGYKEIEENLRQAVALMPGYEFPPAYLATNLILSGRREEALEMRARALAINPDFGPDNCAFQFSMLHDPRQAALFKDAMNALWAI